MAKVLTTLGRLRDKEDGTAISPNIWNVNGGRSTIVYYAPWQALVVRAPGNAQGNVGQLLNGLRAAGGP